ncbi:MAG: response regulator transcription factor [Actinomycetales bacterium]|nr:response regulator transcription factor [Actinomycetales bacterium]
MTGRSVESVGGNSSDLLTPKHEIRVAIVDDHEAVREGFRSVCERYGFQLISASDTVAELLDSNALRENDVVVLDLSLADGSKPSENVANLIAQGAKVLIFSIADKRSQVTEALRAGAGALIRKSQTMAELAEAIELVASNVEVNNTETSAVIDSDADFKLRAGLSAKEREVLSLYASGFTMRQVASQLQIKESTVKEHIDRVRGKYSSVGRPAPDKANLVLRAIEDGLIDAVQL